MEGAHFHLMVNHFPIIGTVIGMLILLAGTILKNNTVKQTGLGTLLFATLSVFLALLTGDPAGDAVKGLPGVMESKIEHHENLAYSSLWGMIPMALLAMLALYSYWKKEKAAATLAWITLFLSVIVIALMTWVGLSGGEIRHTEIRKDSSVIVPVTDDNSSENEHENH